MAENSLGTLIESLELAREHLGLITGAVYRCHLMSGDRIEDVGFCECAHDTAAILKFTILLDSEPTNLGAEIWHGTRLVARIPKRERSSKTRNPDADLMRERRAARVGRSARRSTT
jgi:hypothetical protein